MLSEERTKKTTKTSQIKQAKVVKPVTEINLRSSIRDIRGIGEYYSRTLIQAGFKTCSDLLWLFPKVHLKIEVQDSIQINLSTSIAMNLTIMSVTIKSGARKISVLKCVNKAGQEVYVTFFSHSKVFYKGSRICVFGEVKQEYGKYFMTHPKWVCGHLTEFMENSYPVEKVPSAIIQKSVLHVLDSFPEHREWLPKELIDQKGWFSLYDSLRIMQTSDDQSALIKASDRLKFEEALSYLLGLHTAQKSAMKSGEQYRLTEHDLTDILAKFGFDLTECQSRSWEAIKSDLLSDKQMLRVLYGDVGSGKTLIAILALAMTYKSGRQAVFLAPTAILASQHYELLTKLMPGENIVLLTGSTSGKKVHAKIKEENCIIVGTHAVLQGKVEYNKLGLLVIDEQHRFGVLQRMAIDQSLCYNVLLMTATPIPRTLRLTLDSAVDVSQILLRPQRHRDLAVELSYKLDHMVNLAREFIDRGENVFWVCPFIVKSEGRDNIMDLLTRSEYLKSIFGDMVGVVHGRLTNANKEDVLTKFYNKEFRLLVSTSVIEVGINVPHANLMVIENPEVFGMAQLYQLIGRVGRGSRPGLCYMFHGFISHEARARLKALKECKSGLELAEHDMYLRGAGNILGVEQSGETYFHLLDLARDFEVLSEAQKVLAHLLSKPDFDTTLLMDVFAYLYSPWSGG